VEFSNDALVLINEWFCCISFQRFINFSKGLYYNDLRIKKKETKAPGIWMLSIVYGERNTKWGIQRDT
jgi:hypothetical protein